MEDHEIDALVQAAADGDAQALDRLLEGYLPELQAFVRLRAGPQIRAHESSADIVQSVCREVLEHRGRFRFPSESAFKRWLFTTALRKISNRREYWTAEKRDERRAIPIAGPTTSRASAAEERIFLTYSSFATPSQGAAVREEMERIESAFEELSEEHREVITLAHVVGLSRAEIAAEMDRSEGAVRVLLHRALARLAAVLDGK